MRPVRAPSPGLRLAIDYGPLLVFFLVSFLAPGTVCRSIVAIFSRKLDAEDAVKALLLARVMVATASFVVATLIAVAVSRIKLRHVSPMLYLSATLVLVFGGLTWYFADQKFIQMKPTFVYVILAAVLGFGLVTGRPLLEGLLGVAYPGLTATGWRKLTVNWTAFFALLAVANEIARAALSFDAWVFFKFPGCTVVTIAFALANVPMLMRNGLAIDEDGAAAEQLPPE
ncbi:inner membrane-spanning protein YciB [Sphingomonas sp.]|uniref:inner membrane-spanning protein YciB n=1 Tax=Sphingomonas sp. TaxID=28214 RepID=UPI003CC553F6